MLQCYCSSLICPKPSWACRCLLSCTSTIVPCHCSDLVLLCSLLRGSSSSTARCMFRISAGRGFFPLLLILACTMSKMRAECRRDPDSERPVRTPRRDKYRSFSHQKENMVHQQRLDAEVETSCTSCHSGLAKLRRATTLRTIWWHNERYCQSALSLE
jgi:hypothetical protein